MSTPIPTDESARLTALHALKVLDSAPEADFDDIVALASDICGAPVSLVSLVDAGRQWFKAKVGMDVEETSRDVSFCAHAIMGRDLMVVPDASADSRFAANPWVQIEHGVRFYAGAPLVTSGGSALGTLCVVDHDPHRLGLDQLRALRALARQVTEELELRRRIVAPTATDAPDLRGDDLAYLVEGRVTALRPIADARNTAITLMSHGRTAIRADPWCLPRALAYVVFTALKAAPAGGRVAVRVSAEPSPNVEICYSGGSLTPAWENDLAHGGPADAPVPAAVAGILRAHGAEVRTVHDSLDVRTRLTFPGA